MIGLWVQLDVQGRAVCDQQIQPPWLMMKPAAGTVPACSINTVRSHALVPALSWSERLDQQTRNGPGI